MSHSTILSVCAATILLHHNAPALQQVDTAGAELVRQLQRRLLQFLAQAPTPLAMLDFEKDLRDLFDETGRQVLQLACNHIEPADPQDAPKHLEHEHLDYARKNAKSSNRGGIATLFGTIELQRWLYEPLQEARDQSQPSLVPLEVNLGIVAGNATPALAERVGLLASQHTQQELLDLLARDHHVAWSVGTLRKVTAAISDGIGPYLQAARAEQLLAWLKEADQSCGRHKIVLSVGRDGIMLPIRDAATYKEGGVATLSVHDRRGRRLGTVYLGTMPEPGQGQLSQLLTDLLTTVLQQWTGPQPRLVYVTDAGYHPEHYFRTVLARMTDPRRPGQLLPWIRIVDYYHATSYVSQLAEVLFGEEKSRRAWYQRLCSLLRTASGGVQRVLRSAAYYHAQQVWPQAAEKAYQEAYHYLRRHGGGMDYARYRQQGLPIGSGVTEAGCKIVFTARFKQSGMKWQRVGGTVIVVVRVACLSGVYEEAFARYLAGRPLVEMGTADTSVAETGEKAA